MKETVCTNQTAHDSCAWSHGAGQSGGETDTRGDPERVKRCDRSNQLLLLFTHNNADVRLRQDVGGFLAVVMVLYFISREGVLAVFYIYC